MAARVTRSSQRFAKPVEVPTTLPVKTATTKNLRRQRKNSDSSEKSFVESIGSENVQNNKTNVNITPPKQGKFEGHRHHEQYSPSTLLNRMSLDHDDERSKAKPKNTIDKARKTLNVGEMDQLYGRETELADLKEFLESNMKNKTSASMYISGQPGEFREYFFREITIYVTITTPLQARGKQRVSKNCFDRNLYRTNSKRCTSIARPSKLRP